ncbi:Uncharacterised protein [Haemophilus parainfluenzae]|uniref:Uncharacterized protein n=1 Tax=Haemophilus parainfluenzae TaxID=729 RepID=A0A448PX42_HAEPA|nr:Uncharacterised protein [Haemophilus parainfluenzae]
MMYKIIIHIVIYKAQIKKKTVHSQTTPPHTPHSYPVSPTTPVGKFPPASRLCSVYRSWATEFVRCSRVRVRRRWWPEFGRAGRLKTRWGRGGGFAYTTARPQRRFAPSFLPSTSLGRKAGFRLSGRVWACRVCIPRVSDGLFSFPPPPNPTLR